MGQAVQTRRTDWDASLGSTLHERGWREVSGRTRLGSPWRDVWLEHNRLSADRALAEAANGRAFRFRTRFRTAADGDIYLDAAARPVRGTTAG